MMKLSTNAGITYEANKIESFFLYFFFTWNCTKTTIELKLLFDLVATRISKGLQLKLINNILLFETLPWFPYQWKLLLTRDGKALRGMLCGHKGLCILRARSGEKAKKSYQQVNLFFLFFINQNENRVANIYFHQ